MYFIESIKGDGVLELAISEQGKKKGQSMDPHCTHYFTCINLFNLYAENIMRNAGLDEAQTGIKTTGRNITDLDIQMIPPLWQKAKN